MKRILLPAALSFFTLGAFAQNHDKGTFKEYQPGYYQNTILKGLEDARKDQNAKEKKKSFKMISAA